MSNVGSKAFTVGQQIGDLTIIAREGVSGRVPTWRCRCTCGKECVKPTTSLKKGIGLSCGCKNKTGGRPAWTSDAHRLWVIFCQQQRQRGFEVSITETQFANLITSSCHYCGAEPAAKVVSATGARKTVIGNGIDRVDSRKGYVPGNVVACCKRCNVAKSDMEVTTFMDHVKAMYHKMFG